MVEKSQLDFVDTVRKSGGAASSFLKSVIKKRLLQLIFTKIPFLGGGIFGGVVGIAVGWLIGKGLKIVQELVEQQIIFLKIDFNVNGQHRDYTKAHTKLRRAATKEDKQNAQKELDKAFADFADLN